MRLKPSASRPISCGTGTLSRMPGELDEEYREGIRLAERLMIPATL
jgi:hypothetical protein